MATKIADVQEQVQKAWSGLFAQELKEDTLLVGLLNKDYEGEIKKGFDTVYSTQIVRPLGATKTIGSGDYDSYSSEKLQTQRIAIVADKIFEAGIEFDSLVQLQSQLGDADSAIRQAMKEAVEIQINNYLYSLFSGTNNAGTVTDFNASQLSALRKFAGQKKWRKDGGWYCLADSSYHADLLNSQTLTSQDYVAGEQPVVAGQIMNRRYGFGILEDNSDGLLSKIGDLSGTDTEDVAVAFHKDAIHLALADQVQFKVSDLHAMKRRGFFLSAEIIGGAKAGHDHDDLHKIVFNT